MFDIISNVANMDTGTGDCDDILMYNVKSTATEYGIKQAT